MDDTRATRATPATTAAIAIEKNVQATMRDGTVLRADVYRPAAAGRYPTLVQRTPYNKELLALSTITLDPIRAAAAGYAVVIQDVRGRWASDGGPFFIYRDEAQDGHDTVAWVAAQPWSDGQVGAYGVSYMGGTAWLAASTAPPALRAIAPVTAPNDFWRDNLFRGGAFNWGLFVFWTMQAVAPSALLRVRKNRPDPWPAFLQFVDDADALEQQVRHLPPLTLPALRPEDTDFVPFFFESMKHAVPDAWTDSMLMTGKHKRVRVPALIVGGWHDPLLSGDLAHYARMRAEAATEEARQGTRLIIGPWTHGAFLSASGDVDYGLRASGLFLDLREDLTGLHLRWFDRWLRGRANGIEQESPVRLFVQGLNRWRDEAAWPLARARETNLYLRAGGALSFEPPRDRAAPDTYVYDPADPCPTCGGALLMPPTYRRGPVDQAPILSRGDVLAYTTPPLPQDLEITGPLAAVLYAATSAPDTDWMVKLCEVYSDGRTLNICDGVLRARYWRSVEAPEPVEPDAVQRYEIDLTATSILIRAGHRLRVLVTSSDFPRYDRNPNTGASGLEATELRPARQRLFHDAQRASHLRLPVVPR